MIFFFFLSRGGFFRFSAFWLFRLDPPGGAVDKLCSKDFVPELAGNAEASLEVCKVVLQVVFLELAVPCRQSEFSVLTQGDRRDSGRRGGKTNDLWCRK